MYFWNSPGGGKGFLFSIFNEYPLSHIRVNNFKAFSSEIPFLSIFRKKNNQDYSPRSEKYISPFLFTSPICSLFCYWQSNKNPKSIKEPIKDLMFKFYIPSVQLLLLTTHYSTKPPGGQNSRSTSSAIFALYNLPRSFNSLKKLTSYFFPPISGRTTFPLAPKERSKKAIFGNM